MPTGHSPLLLLVLSFFFSFGLLARILSQTAMAAAATPMPGCLAAGEPDDDPHRIYLILVVPSTLNPAPLFPFWRDGSQEQRG